MLQNLWNLWWVWPWLKFIFFLCLRAIFSLFQDLWWRINGTYTLIRHAQHPESYELSAQIHDVWFHGTIGTIGPYTYNFFATHNTFTSPAYVLSDHVSLGNISAKEALFVETHPSVSVYDYKRCGFVKSAQLQFARRIITMPLDSFHKLAEEIGNPKGQVVMITNTARCGSTLLSKIFEETGECFSMIEPNVFATLTLFIEKEKDVYQRLVQNTLRIVCKPVQNKYTTYVIKNPGSCFEIIPPLQKCMPEVKHLFIYRNGLKSVQSMVRAFGNLPFYPPLVIYFRLNPMNMMLQSAVGRDAPESLKKNLGSKLKSLEYLACLGWSTSIRHYEKLQTKGCAIGAVKYEDLVDDPRSAITSILKYCSLDTALCDKAIKAMDHDSQATLAISKTKLKNVSEFSYSGQCKKTMEEIIGILDGPGLTEDVRVSGTITNKKEQYN